MKIDFTPSYFMDEIREQFYIPGMIKRSWAAQMDILCHVVNICDRHGIKWFATYGTLLGAVRHNGFIPWDDDLDIAMLREDYELFNKVAKDELPEHYRILNMNTELEYCDFLTRITNGISLNMSNDYLADNVGFPYVAGIDIFPLDYIFSDEAKEEIRLSKCKFIWGLLENIDSCKLSDKEIAYEVKRKTGLTLDRSIPVKPALYLLLDKLYTECPKEKASEVVVMPVWIMYGTQKCSISLFSDYIDIPFENTYVKAPVGYDELLRIEYGAWERSIKSGGTHDYPYYRHQENTLIEEKHIAPYRYIPKPEDLCRNRKEYLAKTDNIYAILSTLNKATKMINGVVSSHDNTTLTELLNSCQQLAINAGTKIEQSYDDVQAVITLLENYCEIIYEMSLTADETAGLQLEETINKAISISATVIDEYYILRQSAGVIIFMPVLAKDWIYMEAYYNRVESENKGKVYVMPLPYADREDDGAAGEFITDYDFFSKELPLIAFDSINLDNEIIAEIVIQNPWDEYGSGRVVHPAFFASNIKNKTHKLTYIPSFRLPEIKKTEEKSITNAEHYAVSPGVIHSDYTILSSDSEKNLYIDWLIKATGKNDTGYWDGKILVDESDKVVTDLTSGCDGKKKLLFYFSVSDMYVYRESVIEKIRKSFELFSDNADIEVLWLQDEKITEIIDKNMPEIASDFKLLTQSFLDAGLGKMVECQDRKKAIEEADAFYGSGGYALNMCVNRGIPVMIRNLNV